VKLKNSDIYGFIHEIYKNDGDALKFLLPHSESVAKFAVEIAKKQNADVDFVLRASLLHDIGIFLTDTPKLDCKGRAPYIQHGILGRELLEKHGFLREAIVAETHVGVGITKEHILKNGLQLPPKDMFPTTLEEEIVSFADLFFSKRPQFLTTPKTLAEVENDVRNYGENSCEIFIKWRKKFS
jgi:uncharacterized protein